MGLFTSYLTMRSLSVLLAVVGVSLASEANFLNFAKTHNKKYATTEEYEMRRQIFLERYESMVAHNQRYEAGEVSWWRKVTEHYDLTMEEIEKALGLGGVLPADQAVHPDMKDEKMTAKIARKEAPSSWSWVDQGGVTSVKDQQQCGSCADFAAVATIDTCMWQASGHLEDDLSEQHLMDCGYDGETMIGCDGAFVFAYVEWIIWNNDGLVEKESCAPYIGEEMTCNDDDSCNYANAQVTGIYNNWNPNEDELKELVYENPTATAIMASFMFDYAGGIYEDEACCNYPDTNCGQNINHAVAVVGYGSENGQDFWLIKNSWGPAWGEAGFIRMKRGSGHCGVGISRVIMPVCDVTA